MRNKTISLCPTSFELAQRMPNFSNWVRLQLLAIQPKPPKTYLHRECDTFMEIEYDTHHQVWNGWCETCQINLELKER